MDEEIQKIQARIQRGLMIQKILLAILVLLLGLLALAKIAPYLPHNPDAAPALLGLAPWIVLFGGLAVSFDYWMRKKRAGEQ